MNPQVIPSTDSVMVPVHVLQTGNGKPVPILVAHATGFHGRVYSELASHLATRTKARILAPDLRGHGSSHAPADGRYSWDGFVEDLIAVLDALDLQHIHGFGHSMGGAILLRVEHLRPGSFSRLFVYEPIVFPPAFRTTSKDSPLVEAARRRRAHFPSYEAAVERFGSRPPLDALHPNCLQDYVRYGFHTLASGEVELNLAGADEAKIYQMSLALDTWDHLPSLAAPTTVAHGLIDHPGPASIAPMVAERIPMSTVLAYDHLAHFGPLQDPATIARAIFQQFRI